MGVFLCRKLWKGTVLFTKKTVVRLFFCVEAVAFIKNAPSATTTATAVKMKKRISDSTAVYWKM